MLNNCGFLLDVLKRQAFLPVMLFFQLSLLIKPFNCKSIKREAFILDAHWTMSCGNDEINGRVAVLEPSTLLLLGSGLVGLSLMMGKIKI
jgi:hypothetical protein